MRQQSRPVDQSASRTRVNEESESSPPGSGASEASPLLGGGSSGTKTNTASPSDQYATTSATAVSTATANTNFTTTDSRSGPSIRARRSTSKSPSSFNHHFQQQQGETTSLTSSNQPMYQATSAETHSSHSSSNNQPNILEGPTATDYTEITYHAATTNNIHNSDNNVVMSNSSHHSDGNGSAGAQNASLGGNRRQNNSNRVSRAARNRESAAPRQSEAVSSRNSYAEPRDSHIPVRRCGTIDTQLQRRDSDRSDQSLSNNSETHPPLLEIPEEVYAVRKSALQVLKPLTRTWVSSLQKFVSSLCPSYSQSISNNGTLHLLSLRIKCTDATCTGCCHCWLFLDCPVRNDAVDTPVADSVLVYSSTIMVFSCGPTRLPYSVGTGFVQVHIGSQ